VPITPGRPGVYIEDTPGGVHIVTCMAASITAFGWTQRELADKPIRMFSLAEFDAAFTTQQLKVPCAARGAPRRRTPIDYRIEAGHAMAIAAPHPVDRKGNSEGRRPMGKQRRMETQCQ
jgi:hypothetical protein